MQQEPFPLIIGLAREREGGANPGTPPKYMTKKKMKRKGWKIRRSPNPRKISHRINNSESIFQQFFHNFLKIFLKMGLLQPRSPKYEFYLNLEN